MSMRHLHYTLASLTLVIVALTGCRNPREGYEPAQPIEFSHFIHAGNQQIPCQYCHVSPAAGRHSTVPAVEVCMNCHALVPGRTAAGQEWIKQVREAYDTNTPVEWVKVHDMPKFVYFNHQPHIASGLDCVNCHGDVAAVARIGTQNEFNMGWCVNCHRKPEYNAPLNCTTCHR